MPDRLICILAGGDLYRIDVDGNQILFEMHPYCGPMPLRERDQEPKELGPRHKFWTAASLWAQQGQRISDTLDGVGLCVWDIPPDPSKNLIHLGGRNYRVRRPGEA